MTKIALLLSAAALSFPALAAPPPEDVGYAVLEGLTTEIGPRLAATEAEARARDWAVKRLKALGFANVHIETYDMPSWERGIGTAEVIAPYPQKLVIAALGNSGSTPPGGVTAEVVGFPSIEALQAAPESAVKGKIVFVWHRMAVTQDASSYEANVPVRYATASIASKKGAVAALVRSIGTDHHRVAHTGVQAWIDGATPIAAAALSVPDADQLERMLALGKPVTLHVEVTAHMTGTHQSGNVIAEVPGRDPKAGIVLIGGHLDSWDLGTGAIDDGAGVAITTGAAKAMLEGPRPKHTIRLVWFGAEEPGGFGGKAYAAAHGKEKHILAAESDLGADRVWSFRLALADPKAPIITDLSRALAPLGIGFAAGPAFGGTDVEPTGATGVVLMDLVQDATRYFDIHHTADDTLDKIDRAQFDQNVAAWTAMLKVVTNSDADLTPAPGPAPHE
ncbi:hypothetical protein FHS31_000645 [Sphingomonas vulcanisoli]|uniref:Carboxypeptidase Q n=1 Tax=Sphingomonas vulcanisoli TaxID=1658060 RepID=A0ABX0TNG9_9SPHN|nr:M20/M25/M40 family metallo-hydrolase [Sphingomonas vulcanisoli]NIJ07063.1 hypothetical protein [Sphingomonas vulcanisoli]